MTTIHEPSLTAGLTETPTRQWRAAALLASAVAAAGAFALLTSAVARRRTAELDAELLENVVPSDDESVREAAEAIAPAGKWYTYVPAAAVVGATVLVAGTSEIGRRATGAGAVVLAAVTSALVNPAFDRWLPQPPELPPGRAANPKPVFPSGHTFGLGSVAAAATYVLVREDVAAASLLIPLAVAIPTVSAFGKIVEKKHWPSDVAGGALVAIAIASLWVAVYEVT
jgi:membrane-associated phospholipid phosphatase